MNSINLSVLFLATLPVWGAVGIAAGAAVLAAGLGVFLSFEMPLQNFIFLFVLPGIIDS